MEIKKEYNSFYEIEEMVWSGAVDTLNSIVEADKEDEFMQLLESVFYGDTPTDTEVNDFIWFETDFIFGNLGLNENGNLPEDEMAETLDESIESLKNEDEFEDFCNDCDTCICSHICSTYDDCEALFEDYKNQIISINDIKKMVEEKTDMNIWR